MYKIVFDFFSKNLIIGALLASTLWFYGGYQYVAKGKQMVGRSWQFIGVLVLCAFCVNAIFSRSWCSLVVAVGAIAVELCLIRRCGEKAAPST